jgi:cell division septation protein DedD
MTGSTFDVNFGVKLQLGDFMLGASVPQLMAPTVKYSENFESPIQYQLIRHYIVHTQYDIRMQNDKMALSPYVVMRAAENVQPEVDAGLMFNYYEYFFVGAAYRSNYAVTANAGVHLTENLTFGYAYDFSTSEYAYAMGNSHEFMLRWRFGSSKKDKRLENEIKKLKDKQNRQTEDTEKIVNERLDEFKDEVRRENAKTMEETKKTIMNEVMTLYDPKNPGTTQRPAETTPPATTPSTTPKTTTETTPTTKPSTGGSGTIKGYDNDSYPSKVQAGSKGYYVTAGVFGSENNAKKLQQNLQSQGVDAGMFKDSSNNMFYVFVMKFGSFEKAQQAKDSGLNGQYNGKLWIKVVE